MYKIATFVAVMAAAGLVTLKGMNDFSPPPPINAEVACFDAKTTQMIVKYRCFKDTLESALRALAEGQISLPEATVRVHYAARLHCPIYLNRLGVAEQGATPAERIARNLIGHIRGDEQYHPCLKPRVQALESELEGFLCESDGAAD